MCQKIKRPARFSPKRFVRILSKSVFSSAPELMKFFPRQRLVVSVTRFGDILNFLRTNFLRKVAQIFGLFQITQLSCEKCFDYFLGNIGKIVQLFIPSSGHSAGGGESLEKHFFHSV